MRWENEGVYENKAVFENASKSGSFYIDGCEWSCNEEGGDVKWMYSQATSLEYLGS